MTTRVIILDIDGTLVDHAGAEVAAARKFGATFADRIPDYAADTFPQTWRTAAQRHYDTYLAGEIDFTEQRRRRLRDVFGDPDLPAAEADEVFEEYLRHYEAAWRAFPDVVPFLERCGGDGVGVLSNGSQEQQAAKLRAIGVESWVTFLVTAGSAGCAKPDPHLFHRACHLAGVVPAEACYIGDDLDDDARAATAAGLRGVWLNRQGEAVPAGVEAIASLGDFRPYG